MRKVEVKDIEKELMYLMENKIEEIIWCVHKQPLAFKSKLSQIDEEYCKKEGILICNSFNFGGTIVVDEGDVNLAVTRHKGWDMGNEIPQMMLNKFSSRVSDLSVDNNDLLYQGKYKLVSFASINVGDDFIYSCWNLTLNPNIERINRVCTKEMTKIPKSLLDLGITMYDVLSIFQEFDNKRKKS